jgi:hypothetical protein
MEKNPYAVDLGQFGLGLGADSGKKRDKDTRRAFTATQKSYLGSTRR